MIENETKEDKKIEPANPAVIKYDNNKSYIAKTGFKKGAKVRYEIVWSIPETDEEAKVRYDCTLKNLIEMGVQILSHRPAYNDILTEDVYNADKHKKCQKLADAYKWGAKVTGKTAQTKAEAAAGRKALEDAQKLGFKTIEEVLAFAEKAQKKSRK